MLSFFKKQHKHKSFGYIPRHYDPVKEDLQARLKLREADDGDGVEKSKARISAGLQRRSRGKASSDASIAKRKSNIRLLIIIGILIVMSYYFLQSDGLMKILESFQ